MICVRIKLAGYVQLDSFKMDSRLCNCTMSLVLFQFLAYNEALSFELFRALEIKHWLSASLNKIINFELQYNSCLFHDHSHQFGCNTYTFCCRHHAKALKNSKT